MKKPPRPPQPELVQDYDDGDPYSCIAAGAEDQRRYQALLKQVEQCYGRPDLDLRRLGPGVQTALYDIWHRSQRQPLGLWAAEHLAALGRPDVLEYERRS